MWISFIIGKKLIVKNPLQIIMGRDSIFIHLDVATHTYIICHTDFLYGKLSNHCPIQLRVAKKFMISLRRNPTMHGLWTFALSYPWKRAVTLKSISRGFGLASFRLPGDHRASAAMWVHSELSYSWSWLIILPQIRLIAAISVALHVIYL